MSVWLDSLPTIETERLILRDWKADDAYFMIELYRDPAHAQFIGGGKPAWQAWRHMAAVIGHMKLRGYTGFAVEEKATGETIGQVGAWYPHGWPEPELGYSFIASANGKGYATEAATRALHWIYDTLKWTTAVSMIDKGNVGSKNVAAKLGATFESEAVLFDEFPAEIWRHLPPEQFRERFA